MIIRMSTQYICHKTTMVVSINDVVNNNMQAENLLQIHEKLQHGSIPCRIWYDVCAASISIYDFSESAKIKYCYYSINF